MLATARIAIRACVQNRALSSTTTKLGSSCSQSMDAQVAWNELDSYLGKVAQACAPTPQDKSARNSLVNQLNRVVQNCAWLQKGQINPYGSFISGMYNCNSDMDLAISGLVQFNFLNDASKRQWLYEHQGQQPDFVPLQDLDKGTKGGVLRKVVNKLLDWGITTRQHTTYVLHARVPIVKFVDHRTGIECDLGICNDGQILKATTFRLLTEISPVFLPLYNVVKQWAKAHGINDGTQGYFNSHCLCLLVVFYLQSVKALPPLWKLFYAEKPAQGSPRLLENPETLDEKQAISFAEARAKHAQKAYWSVCQIGVADLFHGFIKFYALVFNRVLREPSAGLRISTWYGELQEGVPLKDYTLTVEEPLNSTDNPARTFGPQGDFPWTLHYVLDVFSRTQQVLDSISAGKHLPEVCLAYLFGPCALVNPPLNTCLQPLFGKWPVWVETELDNDRKNAGHVLHKMLHTFQAPADVWVPQHALGGPSGFKDCVLQQAKQEHYNRNKKAHRARAEGRGGATDSSNFVDAVLEAEQNLQAERLIPAEPLIPEHAAALDEISIHQPLDEKAMFMAALGKVGYEAAFHAALELTRRRRLRDAQSRAKKEKKQAAAALSKAADALEDAAEATADAAVAMIEDDEYPADQHINHASEGIASQGSSDTPAASTSSSAVPFNGTSHHVSGNGSGRRNDRMYRPNRARGPPVMQGTNEGHSSIDTRMSAMTLSSSPGQPGVGDGGRRQGRRERPYGPRGGQGPRQVTGLVHPVAHPITAPLQQG